VPPCCQITTTALPLHRPADIEISPRYVPEGGPATNPALISCMDIMQSVYLPKGMDDSGSCSSCLRPRHCSPLFCQNRV